MMDSDRPATRDEPTTAADGSRRPGKPTDRGRAAGPFRLALRLHVAPFRMLFVRWGVAGVAAYLALILAGACAMVSFSATPTFGQKDTGFSGGASETFLVGFLMVLFVRLGTLAVWLAAFVPWIVGALACRLLLPAAARQWVFAFGRRIVDRVRCWCLVERLLPLREERPPGLEEESNIGVACFYAGQVVTYGILLAKVLAHAVTQPTTDQQVLAGQCVGIVGVFVFYVMCSLSTPEWSHD